MNVRIQEEYLNPHDKHLAENAILIALEEEQQGDEQELIELSKQSPKNYSNRYQKCKKRISTACLKR